MLELDKIIDFFFSVGICLAPSETIRDSSQRGGLQAKSRLIPSDGLSEVCGVFSNRVLPSFLEGTESNNNIDCLGHSPRLPSSTAQKEPFHAWYWIFCYISLLLEGGTSVKLHTAPLPINKVPVK